MSWQCDYVDSGCVVARAVGLRCFALEARVPFGAILYAIGGGQSCTGTDFSPSTWCIQVLRSPNFFLGNGSRLNRESCWR